MNWLNQHTRALARRSCLLKRHTDRDLKIRTKWSFEMIMNWNVHDCYYSIGNALMCNEVFSQCSKYCCCCFLWARQHQIGVSLNGAFEGKLCFHHWIGSVPVSLGLHRPQHAQPLALIRAALNLRWHNSTLNRIKYQIYHWRTFQSNFRFFSFRFSNDEQEAKRINHKIIGRSFTRIFRATNDRSRNFCAFEKYIFFVSFWKAGDNDSPSLIFNVSIHLSILLLSLFVFFFFG